MGHMRQQLQEGYAACLRSAAGERLGQELNLEEVPRHLGSSLGPESRGDDPRRLAPAAAPWWSWVPEGPWQPLPSSVLVLAHALEKKPGAPGVVLGRRGRGTLASPSRIFGTATYQLWGLCKPLFTHL